MNTRAEYKEATGRRYVTPAEWLAYCWASNRLDSGELNVRRYRKENNSRADARHIRAGIATAKQGL